MRALLIIDMQPAYFKDDHLANEKEGLVSAINELINEFRSTEDLVINVRTVHAKNRSTWTLNMLEDEQGFAFDGSAEAEPLDTLDVGGAIDMIKTRDSAFVGTNLLELLQSHHITDLAITGVSAHSCIFHTAVDAYAYDFAVTLPKTAIGDENEPEKNWTLEYLEREYRQKII